MGGDQILSVNRTLTHNLCRYQPGTPNHSFCSNWPQIIRTWPITASFPNFLLLPPTGDQPEKAKYTPLTNHVGSPLLGSPAPPSPSQQPPIRHTGSASSPAWRCPTPPPAFGSLPNPSDGGWCPRYSQLQINILSLFTFGWSLLFPEN